MNDDEYKQGWAKRWAEVVEAQDVACQSAILRERERIIKLLEDECAGDWPKVIEMSLENLIALIKEGK
ncbi:MAG: hypothetical protein ACKOQ8_05580 [Micrococcales bacterium]